MINGEFLGGKDAVESLERERALAIQKIRDVSLLKARLLGETGTGERSPLDAAQQFESEQFVEILEVHRFDWFSEDIIERSEDKAKSLLDAIGLLLK